MADFNKSIDITLFHEGEYSNDPDDHGLETYRGISRKYHPDWEGWGIVDMYKDDVNFPKCLVDITDLRDKVISFYKHEFWDRIEGDDILNQIIANKLFDMSVLMGIHTAIVLIQKAIADAFALDKYIKPYVLAVDGKMGPNTLDAINNSDQENLLDCFKTRCVKYFKDLNNEKYEKGWVRRALS